MAFCRFITINAVQIAIFSYCQYKIFSPSLFSSRHTGAPNKYLMFGSYFSGDFRNSHQSNRPCNHLCNCRRNRLSKNLRRPSTQRPLRSCLLQGSPPITWRNRGRSSSPEGNSSFEEQVKTSWTRFVTWSLLVSSFHKRTSEVLMSEQRRCMVLALLSDCQSAQSTRPERGQGQ